MTAPGSAIRAVLVRPATGQDPRLVRVLQHDGDIAVVGQAAAAASAVELVAQVRPHVVVLDLRLDGSRLVVEQIMAATPTPILVLSGSGEDRLSPAVAEVLGAGAVDAVSVPVAWTAALGNDLRRMVRRLRKVTVIRHPRARVRVPVLAPAEPVGAPPVVGLAASTGGPSALATVLAGLAGLRAPVLVVQHLHPDFTDGLADWMARVSALPVAIAEAGVRIESGRIYLAPGGRHLRLAADRRLELGETPVSLHRPSADELFRSLAERAGRSGVGVLLTGMGDDGARGLLALRRAGGTTFAQDEASSAVFGMPQAASRLGAVTDLLPLEDVATAILRAVAGVRA